VVDADWAGWWWSRGGNRERDGPTARRPAGLRRGASRASFARGMRVREGWACAVEPALLAKRRQGCRERASIERAEGRMPPASVRATRHGLTPSCDDGGRGLGGLVVGGWRKSGAGWPNGRRPAGGRGRFPGLVGGGRGLGRVGGGRVAEIGSGMAQRPAVPPAVGAGSRGWSVVDADWAGLVVVAWRKSGAGWPNGPPSRRLAPGGFYGRARDDGGSRSR
jgi:hypothetical protein